LKNNKKYVKIYALTHFVRNLGGSRMTTMQMARESFLKKNYLDESSLKVLNDVEDLSSLLIEVEARDGVETGVFFYNSEKNEFSLYEQDHFMRIPRPCSNSGKCYKNKYDTCLLKHADEDTHPFERFLQLCLEGIYELKEVTRKL